MLSKLLMTAAIIIVAALFLKHRGQQAQASSTTPTSKTASSLGDTKGNDTSELRFAAYLFLTLMLGVGGLMFLQDWREARTVVTIKLYRENAPEPVVYRAYKGELQSRAFTTLDGVRVVVAGDERMELSGLED